MWSRAARELVFSFPGRGAWIAPYDVSGDAFRPGEPVPWKNTLQTRGSPFRLMPDGKQLLVVVAAADLDTTSPSHVTFLLNFASELQRRVRPRTE